MAKPIYIHLPVNAALPDLDCSVNYMAIVIVEDRVAPEWQRAVSEWLVRTGCRYMMAWGIDCSSWDDSVDWANVKLLLDANKSDDDFVMTTWHEQETLTDLFQSSVWGAMHPSLDLDRIYIVHIAPEQRAVALLELYDSVTQPSALLD